MILVVVVVVMILFVMAVFVESFFSAHLLLSPGKEFGVTSLDWKYHSVWHWVVIRGGVVLVNVVNESSHFVVGGDQLQLITALLGGHSTQLEVGSLEVTLVLVGLSDKTLIEQCFDETGGVLVIVDGQVNKSDGGASALWAVGWLPVFTSHMFWNVGWTHLVPRVREDVLWLVLDFTGTSGVVSTGMIVILVILIPNTH